MRRYSNNKDINRDVISLIKKGWSFRKGKRHPSIISPAGYRLIIPSTPSDYRSTYNFRSSANKVYGKGTSHEE